MLFIKTEIKESHISYKGLFTLEPVPKGTIVAILSHGVKIMTEDEYQSEQRKENELVIITGIRWVGKYFLYKDLIDEEEYINHSENPSMLYHCGVCFALRDLEPGDELTVNYKYFLATKDVKAFIDNQTKAVVDGLSAKDALLQSAKELILLLSD